MDMNIKLLEAAQQHVPSTELLVNLVSRRIRQLAQGSRPLTLVNPRMGIADIALQEIVEGKFTWEITAPEQPAEPEIKL